MSKLTVYERACLYVAKCPAAVSGGGGHNATFTVACALVKGFDLSIDQARPILAEFNTRCQPPWQPHELDHKLKQADTVPDERQRGWLRDADGPVRDDGAEGQRPASRAPSVPLPPPAPKKPTFQADKLRAFASRWRPFVDTIWLAERSPLMPFGIDPDAFLRALFREGEKVVIFTNQQSQGQALWPLQAIPMSGDEGVWYLAQPVDGKEHVNPRARGAEDGVPKMSRRSAESVTSWRHLVLESDAADAKDWMAALVQLPLAIVAIYTSGKRSIHALVRIDAPTEQEWNNMVKMIKPVLVTLGADPKAMSAVRLTRLPGCLRAGKLQKLLWLNPAADAAPICALPKIRDLTLQIDSILKWLPTALAVSHAEAIEQVGEELVADCEAWLEWFPTAATVAATEQIRAWKAGVLPRKCDYTGTPPFADAAWANDPDVALCLWCAGTGHPHGDESYGICECPGLKKGGDE